MEQENKKSNIRLKVLAVIVLLGLCVAGIGYYSIFGSNINLSNGESGDLYLKQGMTYDDVEQALEKTGSVKSMTTFRLTAKLKRYPGHVKSGYYKLTDGMSNFTLVRALAAGRQTPIKLTFNNIRTIEDLSGRLSNKLELDSLDILNLLRDDARLSPYGVNHQTVLALFIPNSYELYWNIKLDKLMDRMKTEYDKFWTSERKQKIARTGLTQLQVSTLASIVEEETIKHDEQPMVAGLYINRQKKGMKLESDPTVKFALQDFSLKRIYNYHLKIDSPYNTYKYAGLPPGPIRIPSINALDAVLNFKEHNYLYMCAKEDFSGYHNFAVTEAEHKANARKYQQKLNELHIK